MKVIARLITGVCWVITPLAWYLETGLSLSHSHTSVLTNAHDIPSEDLVSTLMTRQNTHLQYICKRIMTVTEKPL